MQITRGCTKVGTVVGLAHLNNSANAYLVGHVSQARWDSTDLPTENIFLPQGHFIIKDIFGTLSKLEMYLNMQSISYLYFNYLAHLCKQYIIDLKGWGYRSSIYSDVCVWGEITFCKYTIASFSKFLNFILIYYVYDKWQQVILYMKAALFIYKL
jgi:hypothetical protein